MAYEAGRPNDDDSTSKYRQFELEGSRMTPLTRTVLSCSSGMNVGRGAMRVGVDFRRDSLDVVAT